MAFTESGFMSKSDRFGSDTIYAPATAPGRAGVSILRFSGPNARFGFETIAGALPEPGRAVLRLLRSVDGAVIDQALCLYFAAPKSFTGEDVGEFQIHGSPAVLKSCLDRLAALPGFRLAEPGEFARRAFENGQMDLASVEGLADLIEAETEAQRRQALRQMMGGLSREVDQWRQALIEVLALFDAALDFADEADVDSDVLIRAKGLLAALYEQMTAALSYGDRGERIREGAVVLLAGPPNAGKSTLLNALARREVAIVSEIPGTTRDLIEVRLDLGGYPVTVIDSAGMRESADPIEKEGVRRSLERAESADLILWLEAAGDERKGPPMPLREAGAEILEVVTQIDRLSGHSDGAINISAQTGEGMEALITRLSAEITKRFETSAVSAVLSRARHREAVLEAVDFVDRALRSGQESGAELIAEDIRLAARAIGRITGHIGAEDILDQLFSSFCIGK